MLFEAGSHFLTVLGIEIRPVFATNCSKRLSEQQFMSCLILSTYHQRDPSYSIVSSVGRASGSKRLGQLSWWLPSAFFETEFSSVELSGFSTEALTTCCIIAWTSASQLQNCHSKN
jgi:hypothetical protein